MIEKSEIDVEHMRNQARHVVGLLKAISNENRLLILCHLCQGELAVNELNQLVDLSQSALSQHLAKLRQDGLVNTRRESQSIYYSLGSDEMKRLIGALHKEFC
ncbi:metalloregulator ArsR/SmtB family transcription factor [Parashewanella spongiae]|nr:metalloregulator ArsR/SmtB family transcription factor [Parashewanella spongiae]MCL1079189.1 metalloregulator ArsR/SmtB family transcription factor [Parashewanella spongiae]